MPTLGIDIGTDSVRVCCLESRESAQRPLTRHSVGSTHTMNSRHLWQQTLAALQLVVSGEDSDYMQYLVSVAATCSQVVVARRLQNGRNYYDAVAAGEDEIFVWMDSRASAQARVLSVKMPPHAVAQIGGAVTAEMGIAKAAFVSERRLLTSAHKDSLAPPPPPLVVFELYDWLSYLLVAGGYTEDGVPCLDNDIVRFSPGLTAVDGSVKGWGPEISGLFAGVEVGHVPRSGEFLDFGAGPSSLAGSPLSRATAVLPGAVVCHGCIDSYAAYCGQFWATEQERRREKPLLFSEILNHFVDSEIPRLVAAAAPSNLSILAGTLTCFVAATAADLGPIPGVWGPFAQIVPRLLYAFGQPCTGQLYADLFAEYQQVYEPFEPFQLVEDSIAEMEQVSGLSAVEIFANHLYYGDKNGNRSPYSDFTMDEIRVSGYNADVSQNERAALLAHTAEFTFLLQYWLIVEHLVFQTKQLVDLFITRGRKFDTVTITGSQAKNRRFLQILKMFVFPQSRLFAAGGNSKLGGAYGIAQSACLQLNPENENRKDDVVEITSDGLVTLRQLAILKVKHNAFCELAAWQKSFREKMEVLTTS